MSPKLVKCFRAAGVDNIQFFPGEAIYLPSRDAYSYQVANIVGLVKALDVEDSDCEVDEDGFVEMFYTLRLDREAVEPFDLFRMFESFHTIIVSSRVRLMLESHGITGVRFVGEEDWEPGTL